MKGTIYLASIWTSHPDWKREDFGGPGGYQVQVLGYSMNSSYRARVVIPPLWRQLWNTPKRCVPSWCSGCDKPSVAKHLKSRLLHIPCRYHLGKLFTCAIAQIAQYTSSGALVYSPSNHDPAFWHLLSPIFVKSALIWTKLWYPLARAVPLLSHLWSLLCTMNSLPTLVPEGWLKNKRG